MSCVDVNYLKLVNCRMYIAKRDTNGNPGALLDIGDFPMFSMSSKAEYAENFNSRGRFKVRDVRFARQLDMSAKATLKEATLKNLAVLTYGKLDTLTGATTTAEPFPSGIVAGESHLLPGLPTSVTSVTIRDSAGTPATLVNNTDYTLDLETGIITFKTSGVSGKTQPFKATYTQPDREIVSFARNAAADDEYYVVVIGDNATRDYEKTKQVFYRCTLSPGDIQLVDADSNEAAGKYDIDITPLADLCRTESDADVFGQYGFLERIAA